MSKNKKSPLKFADPMTAMLVLSAGKGIYDMISGGIKSSRARKDKELAQEAYDIRKQAYEDFDFNIQNPYEDIDLSTKAQEIAQESQSQQLATTLQSLKAGAGTSGSAALATSIARASAAAGQKAQAVTEQREMQMQERAAKAQLSIDASERQFELSRMSNLMKSDMNALMAAQQAQAAGQQQFAQGLGGLAAAGLQYGMEGGFTRSTGQLDTSNLELAPGSAAINNDLDSSFMSPSYGSNPAFTNMFGPQDYTTPNATGQNFTNGQINPYYGLTDNQLSYENIYGKTPTYELNSPFGKKKK